MNKPKKWKEPKGIPNEYSLGMVHGYNQCYDKWEEFLPSEEEIEKIINKVYANLGTDGVDDSDLAKAISKRLHSDKT